MRRKRWLGSSCEANNARPINAPLAREKTLETPAGLAFLHVRATCLFFILISRIYECRALPHKNKIRRVT